MHRDEELDSIRSQLLHMGGVVEDQLAKSIAALINSDPVVAREVIQNDSLVDALEVEIDDECTRIVADRRLSKEELRRVMAVMRAINDLERIGDEVRRVAKMVDEGLAGAMEAPLAALAGALEAKLQEMAGLFDALKAERERAGS